MAVTKWRAVSLDSVVLFPTLANFPMRQMVAPLLVNLVVLGCSHILLAFSAVLPLLAGSETNSADDK